MANILITEFCKIHEESNKELNVNMFDADAWADATLCVASHMIHLEDASPDAITEAFGSWLKNDGTQDATVTLDSDETSWTYTYTV